MTRFKQFLIDHWTRVAVAFVLAIATLFIDAKWADIGMGLLLFGTLVVPNGGEVILIDAATGKTAATAWTLRLYTVISPALGNASVVANFTEATGGGYAAKSLTAASWVTTPGSPTSSAYPLQTYTFTGALTTNPNILGYYVTRANGDLVYAEPLAAQFTPANNGDTLDVTPIITLASVTSD